MPTTLLVIADTHLPKRAKRLPDAVLAALAATDGVVHAGDWVDEATLDLLLVSSPRVIGVAGNNDGEGLRARLPEVARTVVEEVRIAVVHETGGATGRGQRMAAAFPDADVLLFGHSHIPWDSTAPGGLRLLNPGSPSDRRRQPRCTYGLLGLDAGAITWELLAV